MSDKKYDGARGRPRTLAQPRLGFDNPDIPNIERAVSGGRYLKFRPDARGNCSRAKPIIGIGPDRQRPVRHAKPGHHNHGGLAERHSAKASRGRRPLPWNSRSIPFRKPGAKVGPTAGGWTAKPRPIGFWSICFTAIPLGRECADPRLRTGPPRPPF